MEFNPDKELKEEKNDEGFTPDNGFNDEKNRQNSGFNGDEAQQSSFNYNSGREASGKAKDENSPGNEAEEKQENKGKNVPPPQSGYGYYPPPGYYQGGPWGGYRGGYNPYGYYQNPNGQNFGNVPPPPPPPPQNYGGYGYDGRTGQNIPFVNNPYGAYPKNGGQSPFYPPGQIIMTPEEKEKYFEKKRVKRTALNVGGGLLIFYAAIFIFDYIISEILGLFDISLWMYGDPAFDLVYNMLATVIAFPIAAFFVTKTERQRIDRMVSFGKPKEKRLLPTVMVGLGFCYVANIVVAILESILPGIFNSEAAYVESPRGILGFFLSVIGTAIFPAILEELLFRGAIMGSLLKFGKPFAIFTSAFLFGLLHGNTVQIPFAFLVGLVLGFAVCETGSIWTAVIIHFLNNFLAVVLDYLGIYLGEDIQTAIYLLLLATLLLVGFFGVYLLSHRNKNFLKFKKAPMVSGSVTRFGWLCSSVTVIIFFVIVGLEVSASFFYF